MSRKTIPRETEKPKKLTRAQKKEIDAVLRKYKGDGKPRTAQATIPYEAIYPDGVCRIDVERALDLLPEEIKETAILFFFQGLKQKEISDLLHIKLSLVKYRVSKAKELLSKQLEEGRD